MEIIRDGDSFTIKGFTWGATYNYEKYERTDTNGSRTYQVGEKSVPSVTTILSKTASKEKQKSLEAWRQRVGYKEAAEITRNAALRGTEMHYVIENYVAGQGYLNLSPDGAEARMMAHTIIENLKELKVIYGSEVSLAYEDQWAGSTDLVGLYNGKPTIIDFKQANKPKKEEWIEDYYYQIAAYSLAHKKQYGDIKQGLIAMCTPKLVYQGFFINEELLLEYEEKWLNRVKKYYDKRSERPQN
tara:strand:- start:6 stop:734 length:729 start_codon:yes stop_codon:yes gene_type:complete